MLWSLPVIFVVFVAFGWKQMREGGGTLLRLLLTSAGLALLSALPMALPLGSRRDDSLFGLFAFGPAMAAINVLRPLRRRGSAETLPLLTEPALLARVESIAARLGVAVPRVRTVGTIGQMQALAAAGGLQAPSLVFTDGIFFRLSPHEQDAIIAHELAHLRNRSLWVQPIAGASAGTIAAAYALWAGPAAVSFFFVAIALLYPVHAMLNRRVEHDCDLRAARAVGFSAMASGLDKIHAVHFIGTSGVVARLLYALGTHPSPAKRYEWLRASSRSELPPRPEEDAARVLDTRLSRVAAVAFIGLLALAALSVQAAPAVSVALLCSPTAIVFVLTLVVFRRARQAMATRFRQKSPGTRLALVGAVMLAVSILAIAAHEPIARALWRHHQRELARLIMRSAPWITIPMLVGFFILVTGGLVLNRWQKLQAKLASVLGNNDFAGAIEIAKARPRLLRRNLALQYTVAVSKLLNGERDAALTELKRLGASKLPAALLVLAVLEQRNDPSGALQFAREARALLPADPSCAALLARCQRAAGLRSEAEAELARAENLPDAARAVAIPCVRALLAMDEGQFEKAREQIASGLRMSPGDAFALLCRAEIELRAGSPGAQVAIADARKAATANPLALVGDDVAVLERQVPSGTPRPTVS